MAGREWEEGGQKGGHHVHVDTHGPRQLGEQLPQINWRVGELSRDRTGTGAGAAAQLGSPWGLGPRSAMCGHRAPSKSGTGLQTARLEDEGGGAGSPLLCVLPGEGGTHAPHICVWGRGGHGLPTPVGPGWGGGCGTGSLPLCVLPRDREGPMPSRSVCGVGGMRCPL